MNLRERIAYALAPLHGDYKLISKESARSLAGLFIVWMGEELRAGIVPVNQPAKPKDEWHEDLGPALWWKFPVVEPPYSGTPLDDDFPDYVTHWTHIVIPEDPGGTTDEHAKTEVAKETE